MGIPKWLMRTTNCQPARRRRRLRRLEHLESRALLAVDFRVATYNALNFGGDDVDRQDEFATVFAEIDADVIVMQEIVSEAGADLLLGALNDPSPLYSRANFTNGNDSDHMLFYKTANVQLISQNYISTALREFGEYTLSVGGNPFNIYSAHLKASSGSTNEQLRLAEVEILRDHLETLSSGTEFIIAGDMNIYDSGEPAYQEFVGSQANNAGRAEDLLPPSLIGNWHNNAAFASVHTQSPRTTQFGGGATGGLDDRFDMIFANHGINDGVGIEYVANSYFVPGNDGQHFNQSILAGTNSSASPAVIQALHDASDHLPVVADFTSIGTSQFATLPYSTGFESGSVDQYWTLASDNANGRNEITTQHGPASGSYHLVMASSTTSNFVTNTADLSLDLSGQQQVDLSFDWKEFSDETHSQDGVYFSDDAGVSFTKVADLGSTSSAWQNISLDVDALATSTGLSLNDSFVVRFQQYDNWTITSDGFAFDNVSVVPGSAQQEYATLPYSTGFESGLGSSWTLTTSNVNGLNEVVSTNGPAEGNFHVVMASNTTSNFTTNTADLFMNMQGESSVNLSFQWKHFGDETHSQDGIFLSNDGGNTFAQIQAFNPGSITPDAWQQVNLDIDALAASAGLALTSTMVVRFQQYDNWTINADGIAIDDIRIENGGMSQYAAIPYSSGFESGTTDGFWSLTSSSPNGLLTVDTTNGPNSGSYHLLMATQVNNSYVLNQADLRINLANQNQATLDFFWKEFGDEYQAQDGIYLSDDGGQSFAKVFDLNGSATTNNTWQQISLDLDALAAQNGLTLSGQFVVRFQQYDNYVLGTDGFAIDDISVVNS
ncbi:MAG: endonuclease/exonuclease/phosphatase family protein [Planctomycetota bacterium]